MKNRFHFKNTLPDYKNLKKTLKGKNGFLFLINDSNNEIKQHFDPLYENNFNVDLFIKILNSKIKFCEENNIRYHFFIIPDKSIVCKDNLPFKVTKIKRNCDAINHLVPDFTNELDYNCYFKNDSHINYFGGKYLAFNYLRHVDNNFTKKEFKKLLNGQILKLDRLRICDLTMPKNWSYCEEDKEKYPNTEIKYFKNKYLINLKENINEKFIRVGERETEYYKNPEGFKDLKVLIFRDSSLELLRDVLSIYFKEILLYWDHWYFNKELIEWYKPDLILEIRTERFLENNYFVKDLVNLESLTGKNEVNELFESLANENESIRNIVAIALGNTGDKRAIEPLIQALTDNMVDIRYNATITLGNIRDKRAIEPLIHALDDENGHIRKSAAIALEKIRKS